MQIVHASEHPLLNFKTICNFQKCLDGSKEIFALISSLEQHLENQKCCAFLPCQPDWIINQVVFIPEDPNLAIQDFKTVFDTLEEAREYMKIHPFLLWAARLYNYF